MLNSSASTILIVDDQPDIIDSMTDYLMNERQNYKCLQAINGKMAIEVALIRMPDLIIMDWDMPLMNGYEALLALKSNPETSHIPVIMATGRTAPEDLDKALNSGAADYIRKPIEKQELLARVRTCLGISKYISEIKNQNEKLGDLNREKDGLMNVVAHDLRSPLCSVVSFVDLIKAEQNLNPNQIEYLTLISSVIDDGMHFIDDLLDVHAFEYENSKLRIASINIHDFVNDWIKKFEHELKRKNQRLELNIDIVNNHFATDPSLLSRLLNNLASNAIKFSPTDTSIYITLEESDVSLIISVKDEGPGISQEDQKKMFKRFQRLSAMPTGGESSNGLGLSIVKTIVERLRGQITVRSEMQKGTEFTITLPKV